MFSAYSSVGFGLRILAVLVIISGIADPNTAAANQSSVFLITPDFVTTPPGPKVNVVSQCTPENPTHSADLVVVQFTDEGTLLNQAQFDRALDCIKLRNGIPPGVVVTVFIHGWRHNAFWDPAKESGDPHFMEFQHILMSMHLREYERLPQKRRRVIGVYLAWEGAVTSWWGEYATFYGRYKTAQRIGQGRNFQDTLWRIVATIKEAPVNSPVILMGHSMGALMLLSGISSILDDDRLGASPDTSKLQSQCNSIVTSGTQRVIFPDLLVLLNSAADSEIAKGVVRKVQSKRIQRRIDCIGLEAPLLISVAAEKDTATQTWFRIGQYLKLHFRTKTDGNDESLWTHTVTKLGERYKCSAETDRDKVIENFGQSWHCLRNPSNVGGLMTLDIDVPQPVPKQKHRCHDRYRLTQKKPNSFVWMFQVPHDLINGHNDIFNGRARLFTMGLVQTSGAVMSLARHYMENFEKEEGACTPEDEMLPE